MRNYQNYEMDGEPDFEKEAAEDVLCSVAGKLSEKAFERFTYGELSQPEFQQVNEMVRQWALTGNKLLEFVSQWSVSDDERSR